MLIFQERVRLSINQLKVALTLHRLHCYFPRKNKTENSLVKNNVKGRQIAALFSQEGVRRKITLSKLVLPEHRVLYYFPWTE